MKILQKIASVVALAFFAMSCHSEVESTIEIPTELCQEVSFALHLDATRTSIDPEDGRTTRWSENDNLAVWAKGANGNLALVGETFLLRFLSTEWNKAYFVGNIAPMAEGEYTYYLSYPRPASVNGTMATYSVSAEQSGEYDGKYDIMVAEPTVNGALTTGKRVELETIMRHQMHAIKITVPEGRNIYGKRFKQLDITFPQDVVGDITLDVTDPNAEPVYSNTTNVIRVYNENGFDAGDDIWVFVLPGTVDGDVSYKVSGDGYTSVVNTYPLTRNMERSHVTPIRMATPELYKYTYFVLSEGISNLGEDFNSFDIYDVSGSKLATFNRSAENRYEFGYEGDVDFSSWQNTNLRLVLDSDHAIVEVSVPLGTIRSFTGHTLSPFNIPYLFEENFDDVGDFTDGHADPENGFSGDSKNYNSTFSNYTSHSRMQGWSGGRYQCSSGAMRLCCRSEAAVVIAHYRGRMDTAPLARLKSNANANIRVTFNYAANSRTYGVISIDDILLYFGSTTTTGSISPKTNISNTVINGKSVTELGGSFSNIAAEESVTVSGCNSKTRLSWIVGSSGSAGLKAGNANQWLYIDNIKVQIAK